MGTNHVNGYASHLQEARWRFALSYGVVMAGLFVLILGGLLGCTEENIDANNIFETASKRVEENLLPEILDESQTVLRNLMNLLPVMAEVCTVPLSEMNTFESALPELQNAQQQVGDRFRYQNNGTWRATWRDVVFGNIQGQQSTHSGASSSDITLEMSFRSQGQTLLQVMPFALTPMSSLTIRAPAVPPVCTADTPDGYALFQDVNTGMWTLSWCAQDTPKHFAGSISASAITRVLRNATDDAANVVSSLTINTSAGQISFDETTAPLADRGIRFYVRPGDTLTFELRIEAEGELRDVRHDQVRLGENAELPADLDPGDFRLASSIPVMAAGQPAFTSEADLGVFVWQEIDNNTCLPGEDEQWRIRFSTPTSTFFSGSIQASTFSGESMIRAVPVGVCPGGGTDDAEARFGYECTVDSVVPSGYDLCVTNARQMFFFSEVNNLADPTLVVVGANHAAPPSPDPFSIRFDVEINERRPGLGLQMTQGDIALRGNDNINEEGENDPVQPPLYPNQISFDPLCRAPAIPGLPLVRFTGEGAYDTDRFEGSRYEFDDVSYTQTGIVDLAGRQRYPTIGELLMRTRQNLERVEIDVLMPRIAAIDRRVVSLVDIEMQLDTVLFNYDNRAIDLTVE